MPNRSLPDRGYDGSYDRLAGIKEGHGPLRRFLEEYSWRDRVRMFDDYVGDTINLDNYAVAAAGTGTAFAQTVAAGGCISALTGDTAGQAVSLITPAIWFGNNNAMLECRFKTGATQGQIEIGFIDVAPGSNLPAVTDVDVPTVAATNCALLVVDTTQTHTGFAFVTIGNFTSQTVASTLLTAATAQVWQPTASVFFTVRVLLLTDPDETGKSKAYCWLNDRLVASHDTVAAGRVNGEVGLAGWIYHRTRASAAIVPTVDYLRISADRAALMAALE